MQSARDNFSQTLDIDKVEKVLYSIQREAKGIKIEGSSAASRLDELRVKMQQFIAETTTALRTEKLTSKEPTIDYLKLPDDSIEQ